MKATRALAVVGAVFQVSIIADTAAIIADVNSNESSHADISLFSPSYGLMGSLQTCACMYAIISSLVIYVCMYVGLSLLFSGGADKEDDEVEQYLQMSVRWAETPLQHLQAMTNLGMDSYGYLNERVYV